MLSIEHYLILSLLLFVIGVAGLLLRRNVLVMLMSIALMLNAVNINLVAFSRLHGSVDGQVFAVGCHDLPVVVQAEPEASALSAIGKCIDQRGECGVVGALRNDVVERDVGVHDGFVVELFARVHERPHGLHDRGRLLELTYKEFELLKYLAQHAGRVFTRAQLLQEVWGYDFFGGTRTVDVHVRRLRAKLGTEHEQMIGTVRNVGYKFVRPASGSSAVAAVSPERRSTSASALEDDDYPDVIHRA